MSKVDDLNWLRESRKTRQRASSSHVGPIHKAAALKHKQLVAMRERRHRLTSAYTARWYGGNWSTAKGLRRVTGRLGRLQKQAEVRTEEEQDFARLLSASICVTDDHTKMDLMIWDQNSLATAVFSQPGKHEANGHGNGNGRLGARSDTLKASGSEKDSEPELVRGVSEQLKVRSASPGDEVMPFCCDSLYDYEEYAEDGKVLWRTTATWDHIYDEAAFARKDAMCEGEVDESNADDWGASVGFAPYEHGLLRHPKYTMNDKKDLGRQFLCMFKGDERLYDCSQTVTMLARAAQVSPLGSTIIEITEYSLYTGGGVAVAPPKSFTFPSEVVVPHLELGEPGWVVINGVKIKNTKRHRAEAVSIAQPRTIPHFLRAGDVSPCYYNMCIVASRLRYDCFDMMMGSYAFTMADYADKYGADKAAATHGWADSVINSFINPRGVHYNIESSMCSAEVIVQRLIENYEEGPLPSPAELFDARWIDGALPQFIDVALRCQMGGGTYKGWYDSTCVYVRQALESVATLHEFWDLIEDTAAGEGGNMCRLYTKEGICHMADWCHDIGRRLAECECGDRMHGFGYIWFLVSELYYITIARWGLLTACGDGHEPLSYHSRESWIADGTQYWTTDIAKAKEARTRLVETMIGRTSRDLSALAVADDVHPEMQKLIGMWGQISNRTFADSIKMHYHMCNAVAACSPMGVRSADVDWRTWVEVYNALSYEVSFNPDSPYRCVTSRYAEILGVQFSSSGRIHHAINREITEEYACSQRNSGGTAAYDD
ncbi:hypothetical protein VFPPC_02683 [Pochonia chlamydosporia 170]|uniref:Uncharacterized protein n=1 Tax=Pochonia chlamydosporia 170 TaxID=1380566 RepID=A0A179FYH7_METCM|nr:hypothetical protein VFPPC_02683 [Pochonia chlamydosporia 170]OAQ70171.1 hypothetical protein VFPPC_02683 [Pochonia chlamydosporia 170]